MTNYGINLFVYSKDADLSGNNQTIELKALQSQDIRIFQNLSPEHQIIKILEKVLPPIFTSLSLSYLQHLKDCQYCRVYCLQPFKIHHDLLSNISICFWVSWFIFNPSLLATQVKTFFQPFS